MTTHRLPALLVGVLGFAAPPLAAAQGPARDLMPVPRSVTPGAARLRFDTNFTVAAIGYTDGRLERAVARTMNRIARRTALTLADTVVRDSIGARLVIHARGAGQAIQTELEDESYTLEVVPGRAVLRAATVVGVLRGLETVLQLVTTDSVGFYLPGVRIDDAPRFAWRGLLVDAGRHFEPVEVIERTLDGMAAVKLNVLHWHLSDDQGFRVQSLRYPRLHRDGSDGLYYTQAQIREVLAYARDRGIRVVPEFDMPGHSSSWFVGYPRYASGRGPYKIQRTWGVFDPTFDPTREEVYRFIEGFITEMAALFRDPYWHIGGDEVNGKEWRANRRIGAFMRARGLSDHAALQAYFNRRLARILARHGKRMVGWDEILHADLPANAVIQSWRGTGYLAQTVRAGRRAILSAPYYLDHISSAEDHYVDPLPESLERELSPEEEARVLGGEACMWGEFVTPETIDSRIWPRLAAVAEKLWSPATVRDIGDMYRRLAVLSRRLEDLGLGHHSHTDRMVRRAVGNGAGFQALLALLDFTQPVTFGERQRLQPITQQTPLVRLVDAARPDPASRWDYLSMARRLIADTARAAPLRDTLKLAFRRWQALAPAVHAAAVRQPLARDGVPAVDALARVGTIGLNALEHLVKGTSIPRAGQDSALAALDLAAQPQGLLRVAVVGAVRELVRGVTISP